MAQLLKEPTGSLRKYRVDEPFVTEEGVKERVRGHLSLMRTDKGIWASVRLETWVGSNCSRCLAPFRLPVRLTIEEEYLPTVDVNTGVPIRETDGEDSNFTIDEHHILDLTEAVRQYIIMNLPMKPLCREGCLGLCPICGSNRNENPCTCQESHGDPRLVPLLRLLDRGGE